MRQGRWLMKPYDYLEIMSAREADLVLHLLHVGKAKSENGWVQATPAFLKTGLKLDYETQERLLGRLGQRGIIETSMRGLPPTRHIRVDTDRIENLIAGAQR